MNKLKMDFLSFSIGQGVGMNLGRAFSESFFESCQVPGRYAFFTTQTEEEALTKLREAYKNLYQTPPELANFDKKGDLVIKVKEPGILWGEKTIEGCNSSISIYRFFKEQVLKLKLYDADMDPIVENMMLARYLTKNVPNK